MVSSVSWFYNLHISKIDKSNPRYVRSPIIYTAIIKRESLTPGRFKSVYDRKTYIYQRDRQDFICILLFDKECKDTRDGNSVIEMIFQEFFQVYSIRHIQGLGSRGLPEFGVRISSLVEKFNFGNFPFSKLDNWDQDFESVNLSLLIEKKDRNEMLIENIEGLNDQSFGCRKGVSFIWPNQLRFYRLWRSIVECIYQRKLGSLRVLINSQNKQYLQKRESFNISQMNPSDNHQK